ncbi:zinc finger protein aebp2-like isoform X2 [Coregonus clupeaformis]|uniref:zinc finger protein aebp2-like isoform X2 n=1 Tax=Coregonus clupeaformis TaxID=59861 RepID=UPI001BE0D253|nr:zinc finger protein aebp2-like isoform X2 [Coregonus clupeaformis]
MATAFSELQTPALSEETSETIAEKTEEEKQLDPDTDEPGASSVDAPLKMEVGVAECGQDREEGDVKPAAEADEAAAEAVAVTGATTVAAATGVADDEEEKEVGSELAKTDDDSSDQEQQSSPVDGGETSETVVDDTVKEIERKQQQQREESQSPVTVSDCVVEIQVRDDAPEPAEEKTSTGGGDRGELAVGDKWRASVEMSSSDGEPLSRMDSEDSISSTLMDMESTVSSGRSTPAMMNGQGSATQCHSSTKGQAVGNTCCWEQCGLCFTCSPDLAEHIRGLHVDGQRGGVFVCLWKGCKVYNTPSTSQSWLQRHMLTHSGDKPFKCVVGGCNASFASQGGLARHVPTHFSQQSSSKLSSQSRLKEDSPSKAGLNKRKKRTQMNKSRRSLPRPHDFFDAQTMDAIRHRAICLNLATHMESTGNGHSVVFHSTVMARRKEGSGKVKVLLHWTPEDILPDVWVNETERSQLNTKVVHLSQLPQDSAMLLDPNIYRALPQKRLKRSL